MIVVGGKIILMTHECHLSLGSHPLIDARLSFGPQAMAAMAYCLTCKDPFSP